MKKSDWIIAVSTLVYSYLFYQQAAGINFLIFNIMLVAGLALLHKQVMKKPVWHLFAGSALLTSFFIFMHHSDLAIFANISTLLLLSGYTIKSNASVIINGFYSIYSIAGSYVFIIMGAVKRYEKNPASENKKKPVNFIIGIVVFIIAIVFFFIYKNANPLFEKYTEKINLDFISIGWIGFTLAGFFIMYGFFKHQRIPAMDVWEDGLPVVLTNKGEKARSYEISAGTWLFILLNLMLLFINALDVIYLYVLKQLPEGITHTQFVHNGVGMIILSIILGIAIILFLFRGAVNFEQKNKFIKLLVALWIVQNAMMIISTNIRNYIYVDEYSLTYKRIGVFVYLLLALTGLALTLYKILYKRSNWFLIKSNAFAFFLILFVSSSINWDQHICEFNISRKSDDLKRLDKKYLISLSEASIPYLQKLKEKNAFNVDSAYSDRSAYDLISRDYGRSGADNSWLTDIKTYNFLKRNAEYSAWQSYNLRTAGILAELQQMNAAGKIRTLSLYGQELDSTNLLSIFSNAEIVDLSTTKNSGLNFLKNYSKIRDLKLRGATIKSFQTIPALPTLESLDLSSNTIFNCSGIEKFPALKTLDISYTSISDFQHLPNSTSIKHLIAGNNKQLKDLRGLAKAAQLEILNLHHPGSIEYFPLIKNLKELNLSYSEDHINNNLISIPVTESLEKLDISGSANVQLQLLRKYDGFTKQNLIKFPHLKKLAAYSCGIKDATVLNAFPELEIIQLNNNDLKDISFAAGLTVLKELSLANNRITLLTFNEGHRSIEKLDLSNNPVNDFSSLKFLTSLSYLNLSGTGIKHLADLQCQQTLGELNIKNTKINSLNLLLPFKNLHTLHADVISKSDFLLLNKFKKLKTIYLSASYTSNEHLEKLKKQFPSIKFYTE